MAPDKTIAIRTLSQVGERVYAKGRIDKYRGVPEIVAQNKNQFTRSDYGFVASDQRVERNSE